MRVEATVGRRAVAESPTDHPTRIGSKPTRYFDTTSFLRPRSSSSIRALMMLCVLSTFLNTVIVVQGFTASSCGRCNHCQSPIIPKTLGGGPTTGWSRAPHLSAPQDLLPQKQRLLAQQQKRVVGGGFITRTRLWEGLDDEAYATSSGSSPSPTPRDELIVETSRALKRVSWLSWWSQVILSTISSVILVFARSVILRDSAGRGMGLLFGSGSNFVLSGLGLVLSATSIIWTWGNGARLSRRMIRKPTTRIQVASLLRRAIRIGCTLNVLGLALNLLAAEQIVGSLAIKVLTSPRSTWLETSALMAGGAAASGNILQPLDILVVQANTNALLSHFCSLVLLLFLTDRVHQLDPPSTVESERNRR